jgi:diguanylate cyclase (GGDEF)-like protein
MKKAKVPFWIKESEQKARAETKRDVAIIVIIWVILIGIVFFSNLTSVIRTKTQTLMQAARVLFGEIVLVREWNSWHGGIYVPITENTKPNIYYNEPDRDIISLKGLKLTKIHHASMTRQLSSFSRKRQGPQFRITSLNPIRPANKPTEWEQKALESFKTGKTEFSQLISDESGTRFQYMAPLLTKKECLDCHVEQGYKVGDIRGGISITLFTIPKIDFLNLVLGYLAVGTFGVFIIIVFVGKLDQAYRKLRKQAITDPLTQISNRRDFIMHIIQEFSRSKRENSNLSVLMCDIDNFKAYNDTYGHKRGDECLQMIASVIEETLNRPADFCARYGGEEFIVILPATETQGAEHLAQKIRLNVENLKLKHKGSPNHKIVTISIGVATISKLDIVYEDLIKKADKSLYKAKANGRNRVEVFKK